jgi:Raf kinase inhibitor-like YbhB/YbcL family protein
VYREILYSQAGGSLYTGAGKQKWRLYHGVVTGPVPEAVPARGEYTMDIMLTTNAFRPEGEIPVAYTCDGANRSPELSWTGIPAETKSIALIMDDPDAPSGTFTHWLICNIPPDRAGLPEGVPAQHVLPDGSVQGMNSFRRVGYGGPCPPPGKPHRYFFRIYALRTKFGSAPDDRSRLERAMQGNVLASGALLGTYRRR